MYTHEASVHNSSLSVRTNSPAPANICLRWSIFAVLILTSSACTARAQTILRGAHAHNDYEHPRPLLDALELGFASIEADIHLIDGTLFVAHDAEDVKPERTLESLYLDPLRDHISRNGGRVYEGGEPLLLLIDIKTEAEATYHALRRVLSRYSNILTAFAGSRTYEGPVTVVISGNRPRAMMREQAIRFAAYDGRLTDLARHASEPRSFIPLVSSNWEAVSRWQGDGPIPPQDRARLRELVAEAHGQRRLLRFWGTADRVAVWTELREAGVDLIGSDDLGALRRFLLLRD